MSPPFFFPLVFYFEREGEGENKKYLQGLI